MPASTYHCAISAISLVAVLGGDVVVLREVLGEVVELPAVGVERRERVGGDRRAERLPASANDGPGQGQTARQPSWSMARWPNISKYCVWCRVSASGVVEGVGEADAVQRRLRDAADGGRRLEPERVEDGRDHVDDVRVLLADLAAGRDAGWPVDEERVARAAAVGLALPAAERRVARPGPAPRVVVEGVGPAELVELGQAVLQRLRGVVEELRLVGGAGRRRPRRSPRCRRPP